MAADTFSEMCLVGAMDSLWFQQIILFSQNSLFLQSETSETADDSSRNTSQMSVTSQQENSPAISDESSSQETDNEEEEEKETSRSEERLPHPYAVAGRTRCQSSSPLAKNQSKKLQHSSYYKRKFLRTRSCKSLTDLELEEVKGFMDLGFIFPREKFTKRLMKLLPGLQRIDAYKLEEKSSQEISELTDNTHNSDVEEQIIRPYLSEAWFTKTRESPLRNLRIPRSATASAADMKKQLKDWARTVALIIQQES
ncbi:uncharacterized protein LOC127266245 [Andrographis paniculata]|uniref:uncharacterized protein LOC127266245 n=1 Tax=Andrographis paniculata TaxID=175694 RepID=UPI0021E8D024|nr:uncharacterized protein LOC127266245 [Andrographis paniculata]